MSKNAIEWETDKNGCWICTSHKQKDDGYLEVRRFGRRAQLHRMIYEFFYGEKLGEDVVIRHTCDNPACINPAHLKPGTHADNVSDRVSRGRSAIGKNNGRAKLTEENVLHIVCNELHLSDAELSRKYGVTRRVFYDIRRHNTWRHLNYSVPKEYQINGNARRSARASL